MNKLIFTDKNKFNKHISNYMKMSDLEIDLYFEVVTYIISNKYVIINEFPENILNGDNMTYETVQVVDKNWPNNAYDLFFFLKNKGYEINLTYKKGLRALSLNHNKLTLCVIHCCSKNTTLVVENNLKLFKVTRSLFGLSNFNKKKARKSKLNLFFLEKDLKGAFNAIKFKNDYELVDYEINIEEFEDDFVSGPIGLLFWVKILNDDKTIITYSSSEKRINFKAPKNISLNFHTKKKLNFDVGNNYPLFKFRNLSEKYKKTLVSGEETVFVKSEIRSFISFKIVDHVNIMTFFCCLMDCIIEYLFYKRENMSYFIRMGFEILNNILLNFSKNKDKNINIWNKIFGMEEEYIPKKKSRFILYKLNNNIPIVLNKKNYHLKDIISKELTFKENYNRKELEKRKIIKMGGEEIKKNDF